MKLLEVSEEIGNGKNETEYVKIKVGKCVFLIDNMGNNPDALRITKQPVDGGRHSISIEPRIGNQIEIS